MTVKNKNETIVTEADQIWNEIKDLEIEMFALPNQRVKNHVKKLAGTADSVVVSLNSPAALPALEATLSAQKQYKEVVSRAMKAEGENVTEVHPKYEMTESESGYVTIKRHVPAQDKPEFKPEYFITGKTEK